MPPSCTRRRRPQRCPPATTGCEIRKLRSSPWLVVQVALFCFNSDALIHPSRSSRSTSGSSTFWRPPTWNTCFAACISRTAQQPRCAGRTVSGPGTTRICSGETSMNARRSTHSFDPSNASLTNRRSVRIQVVRPVIADYNRFAVRLETTLVSGPPATTGARTAPTVADSGESQNSPHVQPCLLLGHASRSPSRFGSRHRKRRFFVFFFVYMNVPKPWDMYHTSHTCHT